MTTIALGSSASGAGAETGTIVVAAAGTTDVQLVTGAGRLIGITAAEAASPADVASFALRDGTSATDAKVCATVTLSPGQSMRDALPGVPFTTGLYLDRITGTTEVVVYLA